MVARTTLTDGVTLRLKDARFDDALQILCETHRLLLKVDAGQLVLVDASRQTP